MRKKLDSCGTLVASQAGPVRVSPGAGRLTLWGPVYCLAIILYTGLPTASYAQSNEIYTYKDFTNKIVDNSIQMRCLDRLWTKESHWNPKANNPHSSAYGIPQILNMTERNPYRQIILGIKYIEHRYKTPCQALKYHKRKGHY